MGKKSQKLIKKYYSENKTIFLEFEKKSLSNSRRIFEKQPCACQNSLRPTKASVSDKTAYGCYFALTSITSKQMYAPPGITPGMPREP